MPYFYDNFVNRPLQKYQPQAQAQPTATAPTAQTTQPAQPAQRVLSYDASGRVTSPIASSVSDYYRKKMAGGGITDATRAKWAEMDDATGTAAAQARMNQAQPGMFGQGRATRAGQATDQTIMQQVAANKLKQAQMAGEAQDQTAQGAASWQNAQDASARADRDQALQTAESIGDTVTMAGLNRQALENMGYGYTDYGEGQLTSQAAQQKADADWAKEMQKKNFELSQKSNEQAMKIAQEESDNNILNMAGSGLRTIGRKISSLWS